MHEAGQEPWLVTRGKTHTGLIRQRNEDAFLELPDAGLWAVADGMGGHACGDYASRTLVQALRELATECVGEVLLERLPGTVARVNEQLLAGGAALGSRTGHWYHAGGTVARG